MAYPMQNDDKCLSLTPTQTLTWDNSPVNHVYKSYTEFIPPEVNTVCMLSGIIFRAFDWGACEDVDR